ncbi:hypothetical protein WMY93_028892 [Mugilogobius chulae]|uniref:Myosin motor domain-containing protein n=1 Tax=Mugilogobius chulae TaxID=88201 RepID=A0AAW0MWC7_9GOBI
MNDNGLYVAVSIVYSLTYFSFLRVQSENEGALSRAKSVPALDPGRGLFRAKSPSPGPSPSPTSRVRSPSPRTRAPVQVPERFRSPEPSLERVRSPSRSEHNGVTNGTMNGNDQVSESSTRDKVVKVVRRVVRKVLPSDEEEMEKTQDAKQEASKAATLSRSFSFKHDTVKTEDDISRGLTNLMVRGRTREPRVRLIRKDERPEVKELERKDEKKAQAEEKKEVVKQEVEPKQQEVNAKPSTTQSTVLERVKSPTFNAAIKQEVTPKQQEVNAKPTTTQTLERVKSPTFNSATKQEVAPKQQEVNAKPSTQTLDRVKSPTFNSATKQEVAPKQQDANAKPSTTQTLERVKSPTFNATEQARTGKSTQSRPVSMPQVVGFIPAPKAPVLSPPPPHAKPSVANKTPTPNPPQATAVVQKAATNPQVTTSQKAATNTVQVSRQVASQKQANATPTSSTTVAVPKPQVNPVKQRPVSMYVSTGAVKEPAIKKQEEAPLSPTEEAQRRLMRIFNAPLYTDPPAAGPSSSSSSGSPSEPGPVQVSQTRGVLEGFCSRVSCQSGSVEDEQIALLQSSHAAAAGTQVKTEEQIAAEQAWYGSEKVWLVHKDGFSLATIVKTDPGSLPEGKVKIRLEHDGSILDVDEDDIEKANPPSYDRSEDLASLLYLNESSVMNCLRQRYGGNLIHTYAGLNTVVINPLSTPSMYSEKVMHMFKGCRREDMAPHIYSVAQTAYRNLLTTRQDQSIVLLGKSGSGKTTNCQHLVQYLVSIAGSTGKIFSAEKWQAVYTILEAFGNSSTSMNSNASRFSHVVSLDFDQAGQVSSASIQTMLLEKLRVSRRPEAESTFNVFYFLLAGADSSLRTELHLNHLAENSSFGILPQTKAEDKQRSSQQFTKLQAAMKVLGFSSEEQRALWLILGGIYHLGAAGATKDADQAGRRQFARHEWAQKAAYLLGCTLEELSSSIFKHQAKGLQHTPSFRGGAEDMSQGDGSGSKVTALECLEAMASGLYSELFTLVISLINRALKSSQHSLCSLLIVDTPGFQNPKVSQLKRGATFEELCHNYTQERLQTLFHERTFTQELDRYKEENIELALDDIESSPSVSVAAVDQASTQALVRTLSRTDEARGLLWLLEEEAVHPGGSEETMLERLFNYYGSSQGDAKGGNLLLRGDRPHVFILGHSHGTDWVEYDAQGWLGHAKHNPAAQNAASLLQDSQKKNISGLFMSRASGATVLSGSIAGLEGSSQLALRRATSMRKTFTTGVAAVKKKSLCIQIKLQVDALIDMVRRSKVHFVHCLLPKSEAVTGAADPRVSHGESPDAGLMTLDVGLLRAQLRGSKLLDALRIYRQGYPDHMVFSEFRRRFDVLAPHLTKKHGRNYIVTDEKRAVEELLESLELEKSTYHMGLSRVFFRAGTLSRLEEQRDVQTRTNISLFQAACRGHLARQAFKKRKIQDLAIRCIQKNIKKNRGVKGWPWWKLFTDGATEEIQQLKQKLEKVEKERNELRLNTDRLEGRITELSAELADERNTGESASQLLETETGERLRLEKDMKDLQAKFDQTKKQMETMEMEVMEARLIRASELNGELEDDDSGGEWRLKYERAIREIEFTKKRLQQELEDKMEVEQQTKRQLERRISDLQADNEEAQRNIQQLKKKAQKLTSELQDTKLHLEGQQSRNHDLEKKQRKFDSELSLAQEEASRERSLREKLARERDMLSGDVFSLRQQLEDKDVEVCAVNVKLDQLEVELQDLNSQESKDEASLAKVKKQLRDLEAKVKDQEEELDEQAGTIQMLEQAKLRLEMEMERLRQTHSKDIESKDDEVEEIRQSCSKKVRGGDVETEKRLRKDLKRTKALLADAQIMLDHIKNNAPSKREIAQLKNQLEEQLSRLQREKNDIQSRMEEDQEDLNELMKKHKAAVAQSAQNLNQISDLQAQLEDALKEKQEVQEKMQALQSQLEFQEQSMVEKSLVSRQEAKIRELETKLEFERTQVKRLESLVARLKENLEKLTEERDQRSSSETREKEQNKRLQRQIRDVKEEMAELAKKEAEASRKKHELEMDIESLEAANQSLQADLKLAFKRIGDLQAAIEDEMESDDNEDLINSLQDMVSKYQKRKNKNPGDSDTDSEVEDRVDGVKSWLSKNKNSAKNLSDDGSLKSSRFAANVDAKDWKEGKDWKEANKEGKDLDTAIPPRSVSVMSSLSYRKRTNVDSKGDALFSALKENAEDDSLSYKSKSKSLDLDDDCYSVSSRRKSQVADDAQSVISQAYSEANIRARKGMDSRWGDFDKESTVSYPAPSRASTRMGLSPEDDAKSTISLGLSSPLGRRTSPCYSRRSLVRSPGSVSRADSLGRSCRLSEFDVDFDDGKSVAHTERSSFSPLSSSGRSFSMPPPQGRSSTLENAEDTMDIKPVSHRNYLDPDLEKAINEVLSFKPIKFKRTSLEDSEDDAGKLKTTMLEAPSRSSSSASSHRRSKSKNKGKKKKRSNSSESDDSDDGRRSSSKKRSKKSKKKSKKRDTSSSSSSSSSSDSESDSDSSSGASTISYRSASSIKKAPNRKSSSPEDERGEEREGNESPAPQLNKKDEKKRKKRVDSLMMKYLYRPDSD